MKTTINLLILALSMFITTIAFSQTKSDPDVKIAVEFGQGFRWHDFEHPLIYTSNFTVKPMYRFDNQKILIGTNIATIYYDTETEVFSGPRVALRVLNTNWKTMDSSETFHINVFGEALYGTSGKKLYGGGLQANIDPITLSVSMYQEYTAKELWLMGGIGVNIDQYLLPK